MLRVDRLERVVLGLEPHASVSRGRTASSSPRRPTRRRRRGRPRSRRPARPGRARTTAMSPSRIPALIIESPLTRSRNSSPPRESGSGTARYSSMFSSASSGPPAATSPTSGSLCDVGLRDRRRLRLAAQLDRARLRRVALDQTRALEVREVRVDGRRGREADRLADLADGGWVPVRVRVLRQEVENLALPFREHWASFGEHVFDHRSGPCGRRQEQTFERETPLRAFHALERT